LTKLTNCGGGKKKLLRPKLLRHGGEGLVQAPASMKIAAT